MAGIVGVCRLTLDFKINLLTVFMYIVVHMFRKSNTFN